MRTRALVSVLGGLFVLVAALFARGEVFAQDGGASTALLADAGPVEGAKSAALHDNGKKEPPHETGQERSARAFEHRLVEPIRRLVGDLPKSASPSDGGHSRAFEELADELHAQGKSGASLVEFLIATVPDPVESGMYYTADRAIEALERGIEAPEAGDRRVWLRDRFWTPWIDDPDASDDAKKALHEGRRLVPGVLTFRNDKFSGDAKAGPKVLTVFLVGESPITGISTTALRVALDFIARAASPSEVRIVGPHYSGSAASLRWGLQEWLDARKGHSWPCFTIVSGTATNDAIKGRLDTCGDAVSCNACTAPEPKLVFRTTTQPDVVRLDQLYKTLRERFGVDVEGDKLKGVALLKERSTVYGDVGVGDAGAGGSARDAGPSRSPDAGADASPEDGAVTSSSTGSPEHTLFTHLQPELTITFPPHISRVRRAYDDAAKSTASKDVTLPTLSLALDEPSEGRDLLPALSPLTVNSNDLVLGSIIDTLLLRDIRYVGLFATDRGDVIFLADQLHKRAAGMRLFTVSSEVLYGHRTHGAALEGTLVVSSYPLLQAAEPIGGTIEPFSGEPEEGLYNATVAILGKTYRLREYVGGKPGLWLSTIGNGGALPVVPLDATSAESAKLVVVAKDAPAVLRQVKTSHLFRLTMLMLSLALVSICAAYWMSLYFASGGDAPKVIPRAAPVASLLFPCKDPELGIRQASCTLALFAMLGAVYAPLVTLVFRASSDGSLVGLASLFVLAAIGLSAMCAAAALLRALRRASAPRLPALVAIAFTAGAVYVVFHVFGKTGLHACTDDACFADVSRLLALGSGVSPVTPLLLAAALGTLTALSTSDRLRVLDNLEDPNDDRPLVSRALAIDETTASLPADVLTLERRLVSALKGPMRHWPARVLFLPFVLVPVYVFGWMRPISTLERHQTFDGHPQLFSADTLTAVALAISVAVLADAALSVVVVYLHLKGLLRRLAHHPLLEAYRRLPSSLARSLTEQLSGRVPDVNDLSVAVAQLAALKQMDGVSQAVIDAAKDAQEKFRLERNELAETPGTLAFGASSTVKALLTGAARVFDALRTKWQTRVPAPAVSKRDATADAGEEKPKSPEDTARERQEDFIAALLAVFLPQYVRALRPLLTITVMGSVLLLLLIASYAFEPQHLLMNFLWIVVLSASAIVGWVFLQLDRDEVLSRIARSSPGRVTFDRSFFLRTLTWGVLPILSLLAVQYPAVWDALFSWLTPMLNALR